MIVIIGDESDVADLEEQEAIRSMEFLVAFHSPRRAEVI